MNSSLVADPVRYMRDLLSIGQDHPLWVFGYGSLLWNQCFEFDQALDADAFGFHRNFSLYSFHHRGSDTRPGLVLGLDRGGVCSGRVFEILPEHVDDALARLWQREMASEALDGVDPIYEPVLIDVVPRNDRGRKIRALVFLIKRGHPVHAQFLSQDDAAGVIAEASGKSGPNAEYLEKTVNNLMRSGIRDFKLEDLLRRVQERLESAS